MDDSSSAEVKGDGSNKEEVRGEREDGNPDLNNNDSVGNSISCRLRKHPRVVFGTAVVLLSLSVILPLEILHVVYRDTSPWIRWYGDNETIGKGAGWCEAIDADLRQFIIEPWNSRSDYAFMVWGCFLIILGVSDAWKWWKTSTEPNEEEDTSREIATGEGLPLPRKVNLPNPILRFPHLTIVNGIYNLLHGLGSFWNHACECKHGGRADVSGMLSVIVFPVAYTPLQLLATPAARPSHHADAILSLLPPFCQTLIFALVWPAIIPAIQTFTILVYVTIAIIPLSIGYLYCWRNKKRSRPNGAEQQQQQHRLRVWLFPLGLLSFGMAYWAWQLDLSGVWCFDEGILEVLQGHAVWHLLSAVALVCLYDLYRSEQITLATIAETDEGPNEPEVEMVESEHLMAESRRSFTQDC